MIESNDTIYNYLAYKTKKFNDEDNDEMCCKYGSSRRKFTICV